MATAQRELLQIQATGNQRATATLLIHAGDNTWRTAKQQAPQIQAIEETTVYIVGNRQEDNKNLFEYMQQATVATQLFEYKQRRGLSLIGQQQENHYLQDNHCLQDNYHLQGNHCFQGNRWAENEGSAGRFEPRWHGLLCRLLMAIACSLHCCCCCPTIGRLELVLPLVLVMMAVGCVATTSKCLMDKPGNLIDFWFYLHFYLNLP